MSNDPYSKGGTGMNKIPAQQEAQEQDQPQVTHNPMGRTMSPEMQSQLEAMAKAMVREDQETPLEDPEPLTDAIEKLEGVEGTEKVELDAPPEDYVGYDATYYRNTPNDNPTKRAEIEKSCSDLDFADLILTGRVKQNVPIMGKLAVQFQSLKASDNLWLEGRAATMNSEFEARAWLGYARLAMSVEAVNNKVLTNHLVDGKIDQEQFDAKFAALMDMSERVIEVLLINMGWFDDRVGKLFAEDSEQLKNG